MNKELLDKVLAILSKHGVEQEVLDEVESLNDEAPTDTVDETKPDETAEPTPDVPPVEGNGDLPEDNEPAPVEGDGAEGDLPPSDEVPPVDEPTDLPPAPNDPGLPEGVEEVQLGNPNPVEPQPTDTLAAPLENPVDLEAKLEESNKVIEGLTARISSLEEALRKGGILTDEKPSDQSVGVDDPTKIEDYHDDDEAFDSLLDRLNRKH